MSEPISPPAAETSIDRRTFARLASAAAAGLVAAPAAAVAQTSAQRGPIVDEHDPSIVIDRLPMTYLDVPANDKRTLNAYAAYPKSITKTTPGVVVVQAVWGVDAQLRDVVRRFAREGYYAIAPDLYTGLTALSGDNQTDYRPFRDVAAKLSDQQVDRDLRAAATTIRVRADKLTHGNSNDQQLLARKVGAIGFCMGGAIALRQGVDNGDVFQSTAVFYGKVRYGTTGNEGPITPIALAYANDIVVPMLGSFGGKDTSIVPDDVRALDAHLTEIQKPHDIKVYDDAGHAFFDDTRDSYDQAAATDAWARTLAWFHTNLASA